MNIFVVNKDPVIAAQELCDKHIVKMILESAQMLCASFEQGTAPYKRTHYNHPCTKWIRKSQADWCDNHYHELNLPDIGLTPFAQAMPDKYKNDDAVQAYKDYYNGEKAYMAEWKNNLIPEWFIWESSSTG